MLYQKLLSTCAIFILTFPTGAVNQTVNPEEMTLLTGSYVQPKFKELPREPVKQSLVVSSSAKPQEKLDRGGYSATTIEEVHAIEAKRAAAKKKAEAEAAAKKAEEQAKKEAEQAKQARQNLRKQTLNRVASAGHGVRMNQTNQECKTNFCWPLTKFNYEPTRNGFQTPQRPSHNGFDMLAPARTPIYAATSGTVVVSSEAHYDFGAAVVVESIVDGKKIRLTYAHMTYGTRQVKVGQKVKAGQVLGGVGSTGNSTANHLHLELRINTVLADPQAWLESRVG